MKKSADILALHLNFGTFYEFLELQSVSVCDIGIKYN